MSWFPSPASPRVLWDDLRTFTSQRAPYQWFAMFMAVAMPIGILVLFYFDGKTNIVPKEQLIYVQSWDADRTDAEIIAAQKERQAKNEKRAEAKRKMFQELDRKLDF